jgi:hypothetical protein
MKVLSQLPFFTKSISERVAGLTYPALVKGASRCPKKTLKSNMRKGLGIAFLSHVKRPAQDVLHVAFCFG